MSEDESVVALLECVRRIAVAKLNYPPEKEVDPNDENIGIIFKIFQHGTTKAVKGEVIPKHARNFAMEVLTVRVPCSGVGLMKVLAMREGQKLGGRK